MKHTSRSHFLYGVLPAFESFIEFYSLRRFGLRKDTKNAGVLANALRDLSEHVFIDIDDPNCHDGYKTERVYRESFWRDFKSYNVVCNFADAWKHREITRKDRILNSVNDVQEWHFIVRYEDDGGFYYGSTKFLSANLNDGKQYDFAHMLFESINMWIKELLNRKIIDFAPMIPSLPGYYQTREDAASVTPMRIEFYTSEPVHVPQACFIFENDTQQLRVIEADDVFDYNCSVEMEVLRSPLDANSKF